MAALDTLVTLSDLDATDALAARIADVLMPGDAVLLDGPVGAGKSALSRAIVRRRLGEASAEVPSPTFTLVQTYDHADGDIWHCDLYRLEGVRDLSELGLDMAFEDAICLIEWPDRLTGIAPDDPLCISMSIDGSAHVARLQGSDAWRDRIGSGLG